MASSMNDCCLRNLYLSDAFAATSSDSSFVSESTSGKYKLSSDTDA